MTKLPKTTHSRNCCTTPIANKMSMLLEKQNTERKEHKKITCHLPNDTDVNIPKLYIKRCLIKFEYAIQITTWATYYTSTCRPVNRRNDDVT